MLFRGFESKRLPHPREILKNLFLLATIAEGRARQARRHTSRNEFQRAMTCSVPKLLEPQCRVDRSQGPRPHTDQREKALDKVAHDDIAILRAGRAREMDPLRSKLFRSPVAASVGDPRRPDLPSRYSSTSGATAKSHRG